MTADLLITAVLNEGKIRHLVLPPFHVLNSFRDYANPRIAKRATALQGYDEDGVPLKTETQRRSVRFGPGLSPNRHLNAVVRHILPSLGRMFTGTYDMGYSQINPDAKDRGQKKVQLDPKQHEIFKEYDRHLTDLANHIISRNQERQKNNREYNRISPREAVLKSQEDISIGTAVNKVADQRHDQIEHRGTGWDISEFGEVLTGFLSPQADLSRGGLHAADRDLDDDHTIGQLKARLDHFYRNRKGLEDLDIDHPPVPKEHHDRILSASRKISIPAGRFQGRRQAGRKKIMRPVQGTFDELRPTAKRKNQRVLRLLALEKDKREQENTP